MKVKLELNQPDVMCVGRTKVQCFYKGVLIKENDGYFIEFKYKGRKMKEKFDIESNRFFNKELEDIQIRGGNSM